MQQRYYDPVAGRFLSVDPVTTNATDGSYFNRYVYALNNPFRFIDPAGTSPDCSDIGGSTCKSTGSLSGGVDRIGEAAAASSRTTPMGASTAPSLPEHESQLKALTNAAERATAKIDGNCTAVCLVPTVRGSKIHSAFADEVRKLGVKFNAEVSYKGGLLVPYGTPGSVRADAVFGDVARPDFVVDLKTGLLGYMSTREAKAYFNNLPKGTELYKVKVD